MDGAAQLFPPAAGNRESPRVRPYVYFPISRLDGRGHCGAVSQGVARRFRPLLR